MIVMCPNLDDEHGSFPHRLVITEPRFRRGEIIQPSQTFVICALCDHETKRPVRNCRCVAGCHAEAASESGSPTGRSEVS